jgi:hypothetical protein
MVDQDIVDRVSEPILREYHLAFQGLRDTIAAIPDDEWIRGDTKGDIPVRQACHLLHACEAYSSGHRIKSGHRFGIPVNSFRQVVKEGAYPSRDAVLAYADDVEDMISAWVPEVTRQALSGAPKVHSPLNRVIYLLRHTIVHLAYLRHELYRRGIDRPQYGKRHAHERKR